MTIEEILQEFRIEYQRSVEFYKVKCPFHDDTNPSGTLHHKTGFFSCFACGVRKTFKVYLMKYTNLPYYQINKNLGVKSDCRNPVSPHDIEREHVEIWKYESFLAELRHRCITDEDLRQRRIGIHDLISEKRVSIPIYNEIGEIANLRLYIPGAKQHKFLNLAGSSRGKPRLYPIEQLEYDRILIVGGELKAIAGARVLNQFDIGCLTATCGENAWPNSENWRLSGKLLYVLGDDDEAGEKSTELRCRIFNSVARELHKCKFPPFPTDVKKGDVNDFLRLGGDLYKLLLDSPEWEFIPGGELQDEIPEELSFREAFAPETVGKRILFPGIISAINPDVCLAAKEVEVKCPRDKEFCSLCDVNSTAFIDNGSLMKIGPEHPALLALIREKTTEHTRTYKECFRIPQQCRVCTFEPKSNYSLTEIRLDEPLEATSREDPWTMRVGFIVNGMPAIENSQTYLLKGRHYPSPKNQVSSLLISEAIPTENSLDAYKPVPVSHLTIFQPKEWTLLSLEEKLDEIYSDLEANVTKVWRRRDYHIAIDLAYHSMLYFDLGNEKGIHGWVEMFAVGDTAQGKSQAVKNLMKHYSLGQKIDCKNVSIPGLSAGLESSAGKHFAVYGALPRNDRGLVVFEELKGMRPDVFQSLTEVRSSGQVQITKIQQGSKHARCRIIAISNPPLMRKVSSYTYGIESALGIVGTHEDLRRFDLVVILGSEDIQGIPERLSPPIVDHKFTSVLCQELILKAWKCEEVTFEDARYIIQITDELVKIFGDGLPVLDANSSHIKIAKLSAALAARTASYDENERLIVKNCHVDFINNFIRRVYSTKSCRLDDKSRAVRESTRLRNKEMLMEYLKTLTNCGDVLQKIADEDQITSNFIRDLVGDSYQGNSLFSRLIQSNAITSVGGGRYTKSSEFTELLKTNHFEIIKPDWLMKEKF